MRYFESELGVDNRLRTDKSSSYTNTAPNSLRELVEGFILQLKIENYSPRTISYYNDYVYNFVTDNRDVTINLQITIAISNSGFFNFATPIHK